MPNDPGFQTFLDNLERLGTAPAHAWAEDHMHMTRLRFMALDKPVNFFNAVTADLDFNSASDVDLRLRMTDFVDFANGRDNAGSEKYWGCVVKFTSFTTGDGNAGPSWDPSTELAGIWVFFPVTDLLRVQQAIAAAVSKL